jgi:hypothetical protein
MDDRITEKAGDHAAAHASQEINDASGDAGF